jgi:hypothetical protein
MAWHTCFFWPRRSSKPRSFHLASTESRKPYDGKKQTQPAWTTAARLTSARPSSSICACPSLACSTESERFRTHNLAVAPRLVLEFELGARGADAEGANEQVVGGDDVAAGEGGDAARIDVGEELLLEVAHL